MPCMGPLSMPALNALSAAAASPSARSLVTRMKLSIDLSCFDIIPMACSVSAMDEISPERSLAPASAIESSCSGFPAPISSAPGDGLEAENIRRLGRGRARAADQHEHLLDVLVAGGHAGEPVGRNLKTGYG